MLLALAMFFQDAAPIVNAPPKDRDTLGRSLGGYLSGHEATLSFAALGFGALVLILQMIAMRKVRCSPEDVLRTFSVTLVITGTLFLISAGYDNNQIAPAVGLFGTLVGYVLGRRSSPPHEDAKERE
jgi:hypothetical protein